MQLSCAVVLLAVPLAARAVELEALTLPDAVARALARNTSVQVAAAEVRRAEELVNQVRSDSMPTLFVTGNYTRLDHRRSFQGTTIAAADQFSATGQFFVPLVAPLRWANWARAANDQHVTELSLADVQRNVAIAVASAYIAVLTQRNLIQVTESARKDAEEHASFAQQQFEGGRVSRLDVVRAQQQLQVAMVEEETARLGLTRAREALGVLVAGDRPIDAAADPVFPLPAEDGDEMLKRRADLLRSAAAQDAALRSVKLNYTEYLPFLTALFQPAYLHPGTLFQPTWTWQLQLILVVPLYDGGLRYARARERRTLLDEATLSLEGNVRQARSELRVGRESVLRASTRLREAASAARLAQQALEISKQRYREGATTNLEVIDAERQARDTDIAAARAQNDLRQAQLDLLAAAGQFP